MPPFGLSNVVACTDRVPRYFLFDAGDLDGRQLARPLADCRGLPARLVQAKRERTREPWKIVDRSANPNCHGAEQEVCIRALEPAGTAPVETTRRFFVILLAQPNIRKRPQPFSQLPELVGRPYPRQQLLPDRTQHQNAPLRDELRQLLLVQTPPGLTSAQRKRPHPLDARCAGAGLQRSVRRGSHVEGTGGRQLSRRCLRRLPVRPIQEVVAVWH